MAEVARMIAGFLRKIKQRKDFRCPSGKFRYNTSPMKLSEEIGYYGESLIRLLFPACCALCQRSLELDENGVCRPCLTRTQGQELPLFNRLLPLESRHLDHAWGIYRYAPPVDKLLGAVKFNRWRGLLHLFMPSAVAWLQAIQAEHPYEGLVPVPLHWRRLIKREFNQADVIACGLSRKTGIPVLRTALRKRRLTPAQSRLSRNERLRNLTGSFTPGLFPSVRGKRLLVIDDILTTGATADAAAGVLKSAGAAQVDVLALAYTPQETVR